MELRYYYSILIGALLVVLVGTYVLQQHFMVYKFHLIKDQ